MFRGSITALVTPFLNGVFDGKSFEKVLAYQINHGTHGIVPCGTTGEAPTLEEEEFRAILDMSVGAVKGRIPVIAGTGSNSTAKTIYMTGLAQKAGVDAALVVVPYYNKPSQDGMYAHYRAIHDAVNLPIVIYNVPSRCGAEISVETVCRLAELPRVMAIKDATLDVTRTTEIKSRVKPEFRVLCGDDAVAGAALAHGADGCISVTSNVAPELCAHFQNAWMAGNMDVFHALQSKLMPLHKALFVESSPAPVKYGASLLGLCSDEVRLPLVSASANARVVVGRVMTELGLIDGHNSDKLRAHG
ncbi:MAG TPA: 4-hydroxy-tetrahydrodipicolinate synthase [Alphaproteobacteria bacterium]|jgi:4-hydroxy-tetrahydrodipicolinate synthase|nr:4-hydroxy-tetrahydrodipicolinate synthase [Alphaproteobacteria bacterium]HRK98210.1 4-hydroxy-tetrahydrodipicolinate synthase [Alphaproteobacteria bacterium]